MVKLSLLEKKDLMSTLVFLFYFILFKKIKAEGADFFSTALESRIRTNRSTWKGYSLQIQQWGERPSDAVSTSSPDVFKQRLSPQGEAPCLQEKLD